MHLARFTCTRDRVASPDQSSVVWFRTAYTAAAAAMLTPTFLRSVDLGVTSIGRGPTGPGRVRRRMRCVVMLQMSKRKCTKKHDVKGNP